VTVPRTRAPHAAARTQAGSAAPAPHLPAENRCGGDGGRWAVAASDRRSAVVTPVPAVGEPIVTAAVRSVACDPATGASSTGPSGSAVRSPSGRIDEVDAEPAKPVGDAVFGDAVTRLSERCLKRVVYRLGAMDADPEFQPPTWYSARTAARARSASSSIRSRQVAGTATPATVSVSIPGGSSKGAVGIRRTATGGATGLTPAVRRRAGCGCGCRSDAAGAVRSEAPGGRTPPARGCSQQGQPPARTVRYRHLTDVDAPEYRTSSRRRQQRTASLVRGRSIRNPDPTRVYEIGELRGREGRPRGDNSRPAARRPPQLLLGLVLRHRLHGHARTVDPRHPQNPAVFRVVESVTDHDCRLIGFERRSVGGIHV